MGVHAKKVPTISFLHFTNYIGKNDFLEKQYVST